MFIYIYIYIHFTEVFLLLAQLKILFKAMARLLAGNKPLTVLISSPRHISLDFSELTKAEIANKQYKNKDILIHFGDMFRIS